MLKKYIDSRVLVNGKKSKLSNDKAFNLEQYTQNVITQYNIDNAEWTETVVTVSSAEILALKDSAKDLLASPGSGKYYDIQSIFIEYNKVGAHYTVAGVTHLEVLMNETIAQIDANLITVENKVAAVNANSIAGVIPFFSINSKLQLKATGANPAVGGGNLRIIIKYKIRTIGA